MHVRLIRGAMAIGALVAPVLAQSPAAAAGRSVSSAPIPSVQVDPGQRAPTPKSPSAAVIGSNSPVYYYNWSGYAAQAKKPFTLVQTTYTQPAVKCPVANAYVVFWVGFDGFTNGTVEQDGTGAYCNGTTPEYFAWWEMFPTYSIQKTTMPISPGNKITALVTFGGGFYTMTVTDVTSGKHFTETKKCATGLTCARDSAEWIVERPGYGGHDYVPLADWGTMKVPGDEAATGGASQPVKAFSNTPIDMINLTDTYYLAKVGTLNAAGLSFPDTWDKAQ
jgi:hypothetical protein